MKIVRLLPPNFDKIAKVLPMVQRMPGIIYTYGDYSYKYAVPFDPKTGIPLTEDVLNDIN